MKKKLVKTKHSNVITYIRPSVKAIKATCYEKRGQELFVYPCINGWLELRQVDKDGVRIAEFIRKEDVIYSLNYLINSLKEYLITILKKAKFKKYMPETI